MLVITVRVNLITMYVNNGWRMWWLSWNKETCRVKRSETIDDIDLILGLFVERDAWSGSPGHQNLDYNRIGTIDLWLTTIRAAKTSTTSTEWIRITGAQPSPYIPLNKDVKSRHKATGKNVPPTSFVYNNVSCFVVCILCGLYSNVGRPWSVYKMILSLRATDGTGE